MIKYPQTLNLAHPLKFLGYAYHRLGTADICSMEMTPYFIRLQSLHLFYQNCSEKLSNDICFLASCRIFTTVLVFWRKLLGKSKFKKLKKKYFVFLKINEFFSIKGYLLQNFKERMFSYQKVIIRL